MKVVVVAFTVFLISGLTGLGFASSWDWTSDESGDVLRVFGDDGTNVSQYAAVHLDGCQLRLVYGPSCQWGTSIYLTPAFFANGLKQGGRITQKTLSLDGAIFVIDYVATLNVLTVKGQVKIYPPKNEAIAAQVRVAEVTGNVTLDNRPGEAFQFVKLSSMHKSSTEWDAKFAYADCSQTEIPNDQWIFPDSVLAKTMGLIGGVGFKGNMPSVKVILDRQSPINGWVTGNLTINDDNVGFWANSDEVMPSWSFSVLVNNQANRTPCPFSDISPENWASEYTSLLYDFGITHGCTANHYCSESSVTRAQMALFISRAIGGFASYAPADCDKERFQDVPCDFGSPGTYPSEVYKSIEYIADGTNNAVHQAITLGCTNSLYCPTKNVTRAEMALFLSRAIGGFADFTPDGQRFSDVPPDYGNPGNAPTEVYRAIEYIANSTDNNVHRAITLGCTSETYCPGSFVRRDEMAAFLSRAFLGAL